MQVFTKADEDSGRIANQALSDLAKAGATIVDPGPQGALFKDAIAEIMPALDAPTLAAVYKELFPAATPVVARSVDIAGRPAQLPPELTIPLLAEREPPASRELLFVMNRYLRERGDKNIRNVRDLIERSTVFDHARIDGVSVPRQMRLEDML